MAMNWLMTFFAPKAKVSTIKKLEQSQISSKRGNSIAYSWATFLSSFLASSTRTTDPHESINKDEYFIPAT
jgi:hypothetical protein